MIKKSNILKKFIDLFFYDYVEPDLYPDPPENIIDKENILYSIKNYGLDKFTSDQMVDYFIKKEDVLRKLGHDMNSFFIYFYAPVVLGKMEFLTRPIVSSDSVIKENSLEFDRFVGKYESLKTLK